MVKKQKSFWIYIIIAIVIVVGGILIYNFLRDKSIEEGLAPTTDEQVEKVGEEAPSGEETGIIDKIKSIFGGSGGGGGSPSGGGTGSNGGVTENGEIEYTDQTICQNAQNDNLCDGLDVTYGEGYRTLCCSEHSLCC